MPFNLRAIDKDWTLFLDRDGVINEEKEDSYILNRDEFHLYPGAAAAIGVFSKKFAHIFMATNQKGIGKGLMTIQDLDGIHQYLAEALKPFDGSLTKIYFCPDLDDKSPNRKPQPGMAWQAQKDFPDIDFSRSIMVGNRLSDMQFGRNAGMHTIFLATTHPETPFPHPLIDLRFDSLKALADAMINVSQ